MLTSFAAVLSAAVLAAQTPDREAVIRGNYEAGDSALRRSQLAEAEKNFLKITAIKPQDLRALVDVVEQR